MIRPLNTILEKWDQRLKAFEDRIMRSDAGAEAAECPATEKDLAAPAPDVAARKNEEASEALGRLSVVERELGAVRTKLEEAYAAVKEKDDEMAHQREAISQLMELWENKITDAQKAVEEYETKAERALHDKELMHQEVRFLKTETDVAAKKIEQLTLAQQENAHSILKKEEEIVRLFSEIETLRRENERLRQDILPVIEPAPVPARQSFLARLRAWCSRPLVTLK